MQAEWYTHYNEEPPHEPIDDWLVTDDGRLISTAPLGMYPHNQKIQVTENQVKRAKQLAKRGAFFKFWFGE